LLRIFAQQSGWLHKQGAFEKYHRSEWPKGWFAALDLWKDFKHTKKYQSLIVFEKGWFEMTVKSNYEIVLQL